MIKKTFLSLLICDFSLKMNNGIRRFQTLKILRTPSIIGKAIPKAK